VEVGQLEKESPFTARQEQVCPNGAATHQFACEVAHHAGMKGRAKWPDQLIENFDLATTRAPMECLTRLAERNEQHGGWMTSAAATGFGTAYDHTAQQNLIDSRRGLLLTVSVNSFSKKRTS
jgi:hypothetical protein